MQFYSLRITVLLGMLLLASCTAQHSDEWHVGYCTAGVMSEMPSILNDAQKDRALGVSAKANGLNAEQVVQGYHDFKAGDDYTNSCKIARKLEAEMR
jgi:hypothetical protein